MAHSNGMSGELLQTAPLTYLAPEHEPAPYHIICIPARDSNGSITDLSMDRINDPAYRELIAPILAEQGSTTYLAPTPYNMSGVILASDRFTVDHHISRNVKIRFPSYVKGSNSHLMCEGSNVEKRTGVVFAAGGCGGSVLTVRCGEKELCITGHTGRDSVIDKKLLLGGSASRAHFDVIEAMVRFAERRGALAKDMYLRTFISLPWWTHPHTFEDPEYGSLNRRAYEFLKNMGIHGAFPVNKKGVRCFSVEAFVRQRALQLGITRIETGLLPLPLNGNFGYTTHEEHEMKSVRNIFVLTRP